MTRRAYWPADSDRGLPPGSRTLARRVVGSAASSPSSTAQAQNTRTEDR